MLILGLTGGIATGKSTVSRRLREEFGIRVIDADVIARQVVEPGTKGYNQIVAKFGPLATGDEQLVDPETKQLNRPYLGRLVFGNSERIKALNSITHPAVRLEMVRQVVWAWLSGHRVVVLDVPLLFESKLDAFCGTTVVVACSDKTQLTRLLKRDSHLSEDEARKRIGSQMPIAEKKRRADYVLLNDGSLDNLYPQIEALITTVQPSTLAALVEWLLPPVGLLVALYVYLKRRLTLKAKLA